MIENLSCYWNFFPKLYCLISFRCNDKNDWQSLASPLWVQKGAKIRLQGHAKKSLSSKMARNKEASLVATIFQPLSLFYWQHEFHNNRYHTCAKHNCPIIKKIKSLVTETPDDLPLWDLYHHQQVWNFNNFRWENSCLP